MRWRLDWRRVVIEGIVLNISSIIVHPGPGLAEAVRARLDELAGVEVHAVAQDGRMIVTIEAEGDGAMADAFDAINKTEGVLSASMVYHQTESDPDVEITVEA
jgi:nitrate reductase NapD